MVERPEFVENSKNQSACFLYAGHIFMAGLLTLLFVNLVGSRWVYYDIGINATSRGFTLIFFVVPIIFTLLIIGAMLSWTHQKW